MAATLHHVVAAMAAAGIPPRAVSARVDFDVTAYLFSHGKRPSGFGSWAFEPKGYTTVPLPRLLQAVKILNEQPGLVGVARVDPLPRGWRLWMPVGTYGEAKAAAARLLAGLGHGTYEVCT